MRGGFRGAHATIQRHHARVSSRTREQALQAAQIVCAGVDSGLLEIAACRAFLLLVFTQNGVCSPKIPLRKKLLGGTYRFKVVIFDPSQVFLAVILLRPCWLTVTQTGGWLCTVATHIGYIV